jgi:hypothetical protein
LRNSSPPSACSAKGKELSCRPKKERLHRCKKMVFVYNTVFA